VSSHLFSSYYCVILIDDDRNNKTKLENLPQEEKNALATHAINTT
jgi:hypothetical protein